LDGELLTMTLYHHFYTRPRNDMPSDLIDPDAFLDQLRAANAGHDRFQAGWTLDDVAPNGYIIATRAEIKQIFAPGQFVGRTPGASPKIGQQIQVFMPKDSLEMQEGFYYALDSVPTDSTEWLDVNRLYFNIIATGAASLVAEITSRLRRYAIPFRFKCPTRAEHYRRADAAVLYVPRQYYALTTFLAASLPAAVNQKLVAETPLFTKRIAPGVALAESPPEGKSFGLSRCELLARGLIAAQQGGRPTYDTCLHEVLNSFRTAGLDPDQPYLNAGSVDLYEGIAPPHYRL
jgi:hypothetical protein